MALSFEDLVAQHGGAEKIPHEDLYNYIQEIRPDLVNLAKLGTKKIPESLLGEEVRRRCMMDLFWMARYFTFETNPNCIGWPMEDNLITETEFRKLADFFIKKDPKKSIKDQDPDFKDRMLLWPRAGLKSTFDVCDVVQWVLCFPDIRILFLTAADDLATGFLDEVKGHFVIKLEEPSLMNLFFPEYCVDENKLGNQFEFECPLWTAKKAGSKRKEPTVYASSVGSTKSGWHYELIKADDAVSDKNSESSEQCEKVSKKLFLAKKLLKTGGYYIDYIGTRYHDEDHYGLVLQKNVGDISRYEHPGYPYPLWETIENKTTGMKILIARAIVIKPEVAERLAKEAKPVTYKEAGEDGCYLLLPRAMPYNWLMRDYAENEETFEGQRNQNPRPASQTTFDRPMLLRATVGFQEMPHRGPISQTWDFAFSKKKGRDYTTASSAIWNEKGAMHIHDLIRARFRPDDLAQAVVDFALKWRPFVIGIEDAAGSRFLEPTILAKAQKTGNEAVIQVCSKIDWYPPDNQKDAKKTRMASLHSWIVAERLKFASYLPFKETLYDEFEKCLTSHHHDDIPDVISQQPRYAPRMQQLIEKKELHTFSPVDANYNLLFGPWLTDGEGPADAFGRLGMGEQRPQQLIIPMEPEPEIEAETPDGAMPSILGGGMWG